MTYYLSEIDIQEINFKLTETKGIINLQALRKAVQGPQLTFAGGDVYYTLADKIYPLIQPIIKEKVFTKKNTLTAIDAANHFLKLNECTITDQSQLIETINRLSDELPIKKHEFDSILNSLLPENPLFGPKYKAAFTTLLPLINQLVKSLPPEGAKEEDIKDWVDDIINIKINEWLKDEQIPDYIQGKKTTDWVMDIINPYLNKINKRLNAIPGEMKKEVEKLKSDIINPLEKKIWDFATFPVKLAKDEVENRIKGFFEPLTEKIESIIDIFSLAYHLEENDVLKVKDRIEYVINAFIFLLSNKELSAVSDVLKDFIAIDYSKELDKDEKKKLTKDITTLCEEILISSSPLLATIGWVVECAIEGKLHLPNNKGFGLSPGRLYEFINSDEVKQEEREFRLELVSALDRYIHGEYETHSPAQKQNDSSASSNPEDRETHSIDSKPATQILTDLLNIVLQTSVSYIFRLPHMPSTMAPTNFLLQQNTLDHVQNKAAHQASSMISRSVGAPVKALSGVLFRGFWEVSTHNDAIVEVVSASFSHMVSSLVKSVSHTLFSLIEIRELYTDLSGTNNCMTCWPTKVPYTDSNNADQYTYQAVVLRKGVLKDKKTEDLIIKALSEIFKQTKSLTIREDDKETKTIQVDSILLSLLKDYGTYLEMSRYYHAPDIKDYSIDVNLKTISDSKTEIIAEYDDPDPKLRTVLRAYVQGKCIILNKGDEQDYYSAITEFILNKTDLVHVFAGTHAHGSCTAEYL